MTQGTGRVNGDTRVHPLGLPIVQLTGWGDRSMVTHRQDGKGCVWATYGASGALWEYTAASGSSGSNFTQRTEGVDKTPPHRFFQISQSLFSSPVKEI